MPRVLCKGNYHIWLHYLFVYFCLFVFVCSYLPCTIASTTYQGNIISHCCKLKSIVGDLESAKDMYITWEHKIFKFSSKNAVFWVHTSQKQSNSKFYCIMLLGSLPSFYWYCFYLIWLRFEEDTACMGNPKTRQGIQRRGGEQIHATGNNNMGWGFQKNWQGTTSFPHLKRKKRDVWDSHSIRGLCRCHWILGVCETNSQWQSCPDRHMSFCLSTSLIWY